MNKWLIQRSRRRWFETSSRSLWRHCNWKNIFHNFRCSYWWQFRLNDIFVSMRHIFNLFMFVMSAELWDWIKFRWKKAMKNNTGRQIAHIFLLTKIQHTWQTRNAFIIWQRNKCDFFVIGLLTSRGQYCPTILDIFAFFFLFACFQIVFQLTQV